MFFYILFYIQQIIMIYIFYKYYEIKCPIPINDIDFSDK